MLPIQSRLKKKRDFERVFKKGKGLREDFLFFKIVPNNQEVSRFGFIVSRKVSKKAIVRNKIKRRLRELVRETLSQIKPGIDGVIVVLPGFNGRSLRETKQTINKLFEKAKIYKALKNNR